MQSIRVGSEVFHVLFPDLLRPLTSTEREALKESIIEDGVKTPIVIDGQYGIIDGYHRAVISAELGLKTIPTHIVAGLSDAAKRRLAKKLNTSRRHFSQEELEELRDERLEEVQEKREEGKSIRQIAEETGVSKAQVERDLKTISSGVPGGTPEPKSGKVTGKDGKSYTATARKPSTRTEPSRNGHATATKPKAGKVVFDDRLIHDGIIKVVKLLDQRREALGYSIRHTQHLQAQSALSSALNAWTALQKVTA